MEGQLQILRDYSCYGQYGVLDDSRRVDMEPLTSLQTTNCGTGVSLVPMASHEYTYWKNV